MHTCIAWMRIRKIKRQNIQSNQKTKNSLYKADWIKFGYSEKATKFEKIYSVTSNFKWKIFSNFVAFSEYPKFNEFSTLQK